MAHIVPDDGESVEVDTADGPATGTVLEATGHFARVSVGDGDDGDEVEAFHESVAGERPAYRRVDEDAGLDEEEDGDGDEEEDGPPNEEEDDDLVETEAAAAPGDEVVTEGEETGEPDAAAGAAGAAAGVEGANPPESDDVVVVDEEATAPDEEEEEEDEEEEEEEEGDREGDEEGDEPTTEVVAGDEAEVGVEGADASTIPPDEELERMDYRQKQRLAGHVEDVPGNLSGEELTDALREARDEANDEA